MTVALLLNITAGIVIGFLACVFVDHVRRIAIALERIARAVEPQTDRTQYPEVRR